MKSKKLTLTRKAARKAKAMEILPMEKLSKLYESMALKAGLR